MKAKLGKACLLAVEGIAIVIALVAGAAFFAHWQISHGGLSLNIAEPYISKTFEKRLADGSDVSIGSLVLVRDQEEGNTDAGPVRVVISDLSIDTPSGAELLVLPELAFRLRTGDIIRGRLVPRYVEIDGAVVSVTRLEDGQVDFGIIRSGNRPGDLAGDQTNVLDTILAEDGRSLTKTLFEGAVLTNTTVTFSDRLTEQLWRADDARAEIWRTSAGFALSLDAPFQVEGQEARLRVESEIDERRRQISARITANAAPLSNLASLIAGRGAGERVSALLNGSIEVMTDFSGSIVASNIDLAVEEGTLVLGERTIPIDLLRVDAAYMPEDRVFNFDELDFAVSGNEGTLAGYVSLGAVTPGEGLEPEAVDFNLAAKSLVVDLPGITPEPLSIETGDFAGRYLVDARELAFDALSVAFFEETIAGSLQVLLPQEEGQSTGVIADASITGTLTPQEILRGWPLILAPDARRWIIEQLPAGRISDIDFTMDMPRGAIAPGVPLATDMMALRFSFADTQAIFIPGVTPLTEARGSAVLRGNSFLLEATSARVGNVMVTGGEVDIPAFLPAGQPSYFRASLDGQLPDILSIIDEEPLQFLQQAGFSPDYFAGGATFDFELMRPQRTFVPIEGYAFSGSGTFTDATIEDVISGFDIGGATGTVDLDTDGLRVDGTATLAGLPVDYIWSRTFGDVANINLVANGVLDAQSGDALGFSLRQFMRGAVPYELTAVQTGEVYDDISVKADLTEAQIILDMLNYNKAAGARGLLEISMAPPDNRDGMGVWNIRNVNLDTDDLDIFASATLMADGTLVDAAVRRLFIRDRADIRLDLSRQEEDIIVNVTGDYASINLFGDSLFAGGTPPQGGGGDSALPEDVRLSVQLDRLNLNKGVTINDYDAVLDRSGGALSDISMSGDFNDGGMFVVTLENSMQNIGRELLVETNNLGAVSAGLFDVASIRGGNATYRATLLTNGPVAGTLTADSFRLANAPLIARLLSAASLTGLSDVLSGEGIEFTEVAADIQYNDGQMDIIDARATGPSLGFSVGGNVDFADNSFDLNGAVAPAYGVNAVLGNIPGFGELLVSRKGEGVVAFSYLIDGPVNGPTVTVNALSLFTPGIFRRIFEPIRGGRPTTAELLEEAVRAAEEEASGVAEQVERPVYVATEDQMRLLRDNLSIFRERLEETEAQ